MTNPQPNEDSLDIHHRLDNILKRFHNLEDRFNGDSSSDWEKHVVVEREYAREAIESLLAAHYAALEQEAVLRARIEGYDVNRQGSWIFIGDKARLDNLDELYWSYVMEQIAKDSGYYDHYTLDYCKRNMAFAGFDKVGIHILLARADQIAKERIADLTNQLNQMKGEK